MLIRQALTSDIPQMQFVRQEVKENVLSDPSLVPDSDCEDFITKRGRGWVCESDGKVLGFAIADLAEENIWALFVLPEQEGKGIGQTLQRMMLDWYFSTSKNYVWLGTSAGTRAEQFYKKTGWKENGMHGTEIKFEMYVDVWNALKSASFQ